MEGVVVQLQDWGVGRLRRSRRQLGAYRGATEGSIPGTLLNRVPQEQVAGSAHPPNHVGHVQGGRLSDVSDVQPRTRQALVGNGPPSEAGNVV